MRLDGAWSNPTYWKTSLTVAEGGGWTPTLIKGAPDAAELRSQAQGKTPHGQIIKLMLINISYICKVSFCSLPNSPVVLDVTLVPIQKRVLMGGEANYSQCP